MLWAARPSSDYNLVCGVAYTGLPIATVMSLKQVRNHGLMPAHVCVCAEHTRITYNVNTNTFLHSIICVLFKHS